MERYDNIGIIGEGSYGIVLKCRHRESGTIVAIKKFLESEEDKVVKKIALREIKMLKSLRHENLVRLIEVFRRRKRLHLVFEYVHRTILDELERHPRGIEDINVRKYAWQILRGLEFCHKNNIIHRDIKPENILVSQLGIIKICDFGFARVTTGSSDEIYTDYVATRWYRAPELLVGDLQYGKPVDIWAVGCLIVELSTGEPLFPGESDIDQIYKITQVLGPLSSSLMETFSRNPLFVGIKLPGSKITDPLERRLNHIPPFTFRMIKSILRITPQDRPSCSQLLNHEIFIKDKCNERFKKELHAKHNFEVSNNALLLNNIVSGTRQELPVSVKESKGSIIASGHISTTFIPQTTKNSYEKQNILKLHKDLPITEPITSVKHKFNEAKNRDTCPEYGPTEKGPKVNDGFPPKEFDKNQSKSSSKSNLFPHIPSLKLQSDKLPLGKMHYQLISNHKNVQNIRNRSNLPSL